MATKICVRGIALHDGKLLCARLKTYKDSLTRQTNDFWCLPGGGLEESETLLQGVEREMIEETGVKPAIGNLLYVQQFSQQGSEFIEFFFHITNGRDYLHINLSKTTHGEKEIEEIGFVDPSNTYILPRFLTTESLGRVVASNGPVRIFSENL